MRHVAQVCRKCKQFVRRIKKLRKDVEVEGEGAHAKDSRHKGAAGGAPGSNNDADSPPGTPLQRRTAGEIWRERDRDHRGLLEDGLNLIEKD